MSTPNNLLPTQFIIGITGRRGTGKDTFGLCLPRHFPDYNVTRISIGDFIKKELALLTGGNIDTINANKDNLVLRKVLQYLGGDVFDEETCNFWAGKVSLAIQEFFALELNKPTIVYVPDIRYPQQANMVRQMGGILIKVERPMKLDNDVDLHPSEAFADTIQVDHFLRNDSNLIRFQHEVSYVCEQIKHTLKGRNKCQTQQKTLSSP